MARGLLPPVVGELVMDDSRWRGPASRASGDLRDIGDSSHRTTGLLGGVGKAAGLIGVAFASVGAAEFLTGAISEMEEAQKIGAQTEAVIRSTGGAANVTAKEIGVLADSLSRKAAIDDEVIQSGANMLLTFKAIRNETGEGNDIFDQATKATLDMSVAMGTDMTQAAIQVGKALNDPIGGVTALRRVGVQLTDQQEESIRAFVEQGDVMSAQKVILAELTSQFGGSAEAQATSLQRLSVMWGNAKERVGEFLIPIIDLAAKWLPQAGAALDKFGGTVGRVAGPMLKEAQGGIRAFFSAFKAGDGDVTSAGFAGELERLGGKVREVFDQLRPTIESAMATISTIISTYVAIYQDFWDRFGEHIWQKIQTTFNNVMQILTGAFQVIKGIFDFFGALLRGDWSAMWEAVLTILEGVWNIISGVVKQALNVLSGLIGAAMAVISALWAAAWEGIKSAVAWSIEGLIGLVASIPGRILSALGDLGSLLWDAGVRLIRGFIGGIGSMFGAVRDTLGNLAGKLVSWKGPPAKDAVLLYDAGRLVIGGFVRGIEDSYGSVRGALGGVSSLVSGSGSGGHAAGGGGGGIVVNVYVQGSVTSERDLVEAVRSGIVRQAEGVNNYLGAAA